MNELIVVPQTSHRNKLKSLVLDSVSSPITKRVYNLGLDEFFAWLSVQEPRPGFTKATVSAWRVALEARGLGAVSINVRITAVRKLAVEAADNGLLAPELANGITRVKGVASKGVRLGNWLSLKQAQALLNAPDIATMKGLRDRAIFDNQAHWNNRAMAAVLGVILKLPPIKLAMASRQMKSIYLDRLLSSSGSRQPQN
jgi:site-specific recombinase XerD